MAGGKPMRWDRAKQKPPRRPPPESKLTERQEARSNLRRLFVPSPPPFDESVMTDDAREQFAQDADGVV